MTDPNRAPFTDDEILAHLHETTERLEPLRQKLKAASKWWESIPQVCKRLGPDHPLIVEWQAVNFSIHISLWCLDKKKLH